MKKTVKFIGGEMQLAAPDCDFRFTDSGRSSLRLILKSLSPKFKYLLPDFLCPSIIDVFRETGLKYSFYKVKPDFSIDRQSVSGKKFDAFYSINYFGRESRAENIIAKDRILIEDNVFLPDFEKNKAFPRWASFNSFRKISPAADGSMLKASFELKKNLMRREAAPFAKLKYRAKEIKYGFLKDGRYQESEYLKLFREAETLLDKQTDIYAISERSLLEVIEFFRNMPAEKSARIKNYNALKEPGKPLKVKFPSFCPLFVKQRDELKKYLAEKNIFLPVHWPGNSETENSIYDKIISIPLDGRYDEKDMRRVADAIKSFYLKS